MKKINFINKAGKTLCSVWFITVVLLIPLFWHIKYLWIFFAVLTLVIILLAIAAVNLEKTSK